MSINHAILGFLRECSLSGYDLKKRIQDSPILPWSGNNNQIYKALVELLEEGWVTHEVLHQESSPTKKMYTITESGEAELRNWVLTSCEPPEFKKLALAQLAFASGLTDAELHQWLDRYEQELVSQRHYHEEKRRREAIAPCTGRRELLIQEMIHENVLSFYTSEQNWIQRLRSAIKRMEEGAE
ncbi:PadR family transcriptional regulator [Paenibacillus aurantiacus]|uniref:PadR family transcriptional regulator n=1 Tax=Paenibacillus aurantiacus TaxID=1936118 RepID=A0ABV5KSI0_9BACL